MTTPTQLEAAMRRAGVGQYENMTGKPYPYKSRLEEAEAIVAELGPDRVVAAYDDLDDAATEYLDAVMAYLDHGRSPNSWATDRGRLWSVIEESRAALASSPAPAGLDGLRDRIHRHRDGCNGRPHRRWYRGENRCDTLARLAARAAEEGEK